MSKSSVTEHYLQASNGIPNNPKLPVLYYHQVQGGGTSLTEQFKQAFDRNNWKGSWVNGVFDYHHYHSTSHEVLGVAAGTAAVVLGGPGGSVFTVSAGDMIVLPAGTGHCLQSASADFKVVGAYPAGQENYDICTQQNDPKEKEKTIAKVPLPTTDPVLGANGPLVHAWKL